MKLKSLMFMTALCLCAVVPLCLAFAQEGRIAGHEKQGNKSVKLSAEEDLWLKNHHTLRVGVGIAFPPFQYMEDGEFKGIASDYIDILSKRLGIRMEIVKNVSSFQQVLEMAEKREIDVLACVSETPERKKYVDFTKPYLSFPLFIITANDAPFIGGLADLNRRKVAFAENLADHSRVKDNFPDIIPYFVKTPPEKLAAVSHGKADACIENIATASYLIQKNNLANLKVAAPSGLPNTEFAFASRNDRPLLNGILNKALESVTKEEYDAIYRKWIPIRFEYKADWTVILKWLISIGSVFMIILGITLFWNRKLSHQILVRKQMEESLRDSEALFRSQFEFGNIGIALSSPEKEWLRANRRLCEILGYPEKELMQMTWSEMTHPEDLAHDIAEFDRIIADETDRYEMDKRFFRKDGTLICTHLNVSCYRNPDRTVRFIISSLQDITELKRAQELLKEEEERSRLILESAGDGIFGVNKKGKLDFINKSAENMLGWRYEELMGRGVHNIIHHTYADGSPYPLAECLMCNAHQNGNTSHIDNEILWRKDGSWFNAEYKVRPIYKDGELAGAVITFLDITERKAAAEALLCAKALAEERSQAAEAANRAKSEFLANMSHELRTPLNAVIGFAQVMAHSRTLPSEHQENVSIIKRSGEHLLTLINQVLELSKIEAGRTTLNETGFDLHQLLDELEDLFLLRVKEKNLSLMFERSPDLPRYIRGDEIKLRQILINLLNNAIKFTKEGGVAVRVESGKWKVLSDSKGEKDSVITHNTSHITPDTLRFEIEDTGPGISPDELDSVFKAFVQTSGGKQAQEGTGLGLAISRKFVQMMGGDITVCSEAGKGSLFKFCIQVQIADEDSIRIRQTVRRIIGIQPGQMVYRILIADDKSDNRRLLVKLLAPLGFELREAANGQEAVETSEQWEPHLIWMDMRMPVMDGYEATRRIKSTIKGQASAIIALTASAFEEERAVVLSAGCDDFLRKPFREHELFDMMEKHLGIRYIYEDDEMPPDSGQTKEEHRNALTPEAVSVLPPELVKDLENAAIRGNMDTMSAVIGQIRKSNAPLADALTELAEGFQYPEIIRLIQAKDGICEKAKEKI